LQDTMMETTNDTYYLTLVLLVIAWCTIHSAMISISVTAFLQKHLGNKYRFYRLLFNIIAIITLIPVALYARSQPSQVIFEWAGYFQALQIIFLSVGIILFYLGARHYDARQLLGFAQIRNRTISTAITHSGELDTTGILGVIRHPWYLGLIFIIWARQLDITTLIVNVILTAYLVVGSILEEKKLVMEFGDKYRRYQQSVSMLIPLKWLRAKITHS